MKKFIVLLSLLVIGTVLYASKENPIIERPNPPTFPLDPNKRLVLP